MVRSFWHKKIQESFKEKNVVWLTGVRRSGKTTICKNLTPDSYFDCELPRVRRLLEDPEQFFEEHRKTRLTLDEIHRLDNASEVLKIAADYFSDTMVIATGSSTLSASKKFTDTLTDRKRTVFLPPLTLQDMADFKHESLKHRLLRGGLPPFFLAKQFPEEGYKEWLDSFWAKDIEEMFQVEKKSAFLKMFELLAIQSGGLFEANSFSSPCGISHTTVAAYLKVMEYTHVAYILRPFHKNKSTEIVTAPKVYFFDTGFISYFKGTDTLHSSELGHYWEHFVLNELLTFIDRENIHIWRDKQKNEVDFIIKLRGKPAIAIECKWSSKEFDIKPIKTFRTIHEGKKNILLAPDISAIRAKSYGEIDILHCPIHRIKEIVLK